MKPYHLLRASLLVGAALFVLSACQKDEEPFENTGKKIDEAVEQSADVMKDAAEKAGDKMEEAGDRIQDSTNR